MDKEVELAWEFMPSFDITRVALLKNNYLVGYQNGNIFHLRKIFKLMLAASWIEVCVN